MRRFREKLCYLASPYSKYPGGIETAFTDVCGLAGALLRRGVNLFSPIAHSHPIAIHGGIDPFGYAVWLQLVRRKVAVLEYDDKLKGRGRAEIRQRVPLDVLSARDRRVNAPHTLTGIVFGDPPLGYSALDRRGA